MNLVKIYDQISQKSEKIWLLRQESGWSDLILAKASPSWKRAKKEPKGQTKIFGPESVI